MTDYLGEFEHLVMLAVLRLGPEATGVPMRREIEERAERAVSFGALYSTLRRLQRKGYLEASPHPTSDGGRPRRRFAVTESGHAALAAARRRLERMSEGVEIESGAG